MSEKETVTDPSTTGAVDSADSELDWSQTLDTLLRARARGARTHLPPVGEDPIDATRSTAPSVQTAGGATAGSTRAHAENGRTSVDEPEATAGLDRQAGSRRSARVPTGPDLVVAIPAYNEAGTIEDVVTDARAFCDHVYVIDDGSDDETATRASAAGATVVEHRRNRGYGAALQTAFREAARLDPAHLAVVDGDGQHDPTDIPGLVERQNETDAEIVIGSRYGGRSRSSIPLYRRAGLLVINVLTNLCLGVVRKRSRIKDTQSGFRVYDNRAIGELAESTVTDDGMGASIDILYHAHRAGYEVVEETTEIDYDVDDANSINPVAHGMVLVQNLLRTIERERPMTVLGVPGFLVVLCGLGFGYWTASYYVETAVFPIGLATVATFLVLVGFLSSFTGLILHALNIHAQSSD
jgi:glycosyltransferase involved in cell wall biosynthesis